MGFEVADQEFKDKSEQFKMTHNFIFILGYLEMNYFKS